MIDNIAMSPAYFAHVPQLVNVLLIIGLIENKIPIAENNTIILNFNVFMVLIINLYVLYHINMHFVNPHTY